MWWTMDELLRAGRQLENRFHISEVVGHSEGQAVYLAADLDRGGAWTLAWESLEMFRMRRRPEGALSYVAQEGRHYLILRLEGQDLGLVYHAAGVVAESWAALWMTQVCDGIGQWHARPEDRLVCLRVGAIYLGHLKLMATGQAILPSRDLLAKPPDAIVPGQALAFSSPETATGAPATVRSDVYALGAIVHCLVTGRPPVDPADHAAGRAEPIPPREVNRKLSGRLEKVVLKALSLDPARRHDSALQLGLELDRCVPRRLRRHRIGEF